jgi:hypothetical protein
MQKQQKTKYQIVETKQISSWWNTKIITETKCKYQIAETKRKMKYQNNCRNWTQISNCTSWREDEIPNFTKEKDKISLQKIFGALSRTPAGAHCPLQTPANSPQSWIRKNCVRD